MATPGTRKRSRSSTDDSLISSTPRAKRQALATIYNDENDSHLACRQTRAKVYNEDSIDNDSIVVTSPPKKISKRSKITARNIVLPGKIKTHFNTAKPGNEENLKPIDVIVPQTPRRRDALSKSVPSTPRQRVTINGSLTPRTPRTISSPATSSTTIYNLARQLFTRSKDPGQLIGRDEERKELSLFIDSSLQKGSGGCIYVSGPPGTGKSALVHEVVTELEENITMKRAYVNCMSMKASKDIYGMLLETLCEDCDTLENENGEVHVLEEMFIPKTSAKTVYVVTLDEIDHVLTLDLEVMYKLFEWSLHKSSRLVLIGIANALDLTDRFLPRLKSRNLKPQLLPIMPYSASQIKAIITTRLKSLMPLNSTSPEYIPFLHPAAIELCSRKVSSQTGDLRKAFDICRRVIDMIENETKEKKLQELEQDINNSPSKKPLGENANLSSPSNNLSFKSANPNSQSLSLAALTVETAPRASIGHLNKVTSAAFGNGATQRLKTLNLQQKAALCALVALEKKKRTAASNVLATPSKSNSAAPTVKALYDTYCMLCRRDSVLHPLTSTEFRDVIGSLETLSLINGVDGRSGFCVALNTPSKRGRKPGFGGGVGTGDEKKVASCVGERELEQVLNGLGACILRSILSGEGLDG